MKTLVGFSCFSFLLFISFTAISDNPESSAVEQQTVLSLDGNSFSGSIKSTGLLGLISVKGKLDFNNGIMIWSAQGDDSSAPYKTIQVDSGLEFHARLPSDGNTFVDWNGTYNGKRLIDVKAVWDRTSEKDFVHDLFLSDKVTLTFTPEQ